MENFPNPREFRLVGSASEENKEALQESLGNKFHSHLDSLSDEFLEKLKNFEIPKSSEQIEIINSINEVLAKYIKSLGLDYHQLSADNYHVIKGDEYIKERGDDSTACFSSITFSVFFNNDVVSKNNHLFINMALHETLHSAMHLAYGVIDDEEDKEKYKYGRYRAGVAAYSYDGQPKHVHFKGLDEAIVSEMQKDVLQEVLKQPKIVSLFEEGRAEDDERIEFPYQKNRMVLNYICSEIAQQMPDEYKDESEVKKEFFKAHISGRLLKIAHLVDDTFGKGSFRILGNMNDDKESGQLHLEQFNKLRLNFKKQK